MHRKQEKSHSAERRRESRYRVTHDYAVELENERFKKKKVVMPRNLSADGMRFATSETLKEGEKFILTFHFSRPFSGSRTFSVPAIATYVTKPEGVSRFRVGCRFEHPDESGRLILENFIAWARGHHKI